MDLSRSSKVSGKELSGPERVALAVKKVKHAQARKIVNDSVDRSFGSLKKKRKVSSLRQSFVMKQVSSLRRQNQEIVNELVKLRKYTTMVENMNHDFREQQGELLAKNIHLIEKIKRLSAENLSLKRLLHKFHQKYDLEDELIEAFLHHNVVGPERIVSNSNADLSKNSPFDRKLPPPMTLLYHKETGKTLPSYACLSICKAEVGSPELNQNNASSSPADFGISLPLPSTSPPLRGNVSQFRDKLQKCKDTVPSLNNGKESLEEGSDVNDDFSNLNLRLSSESAESSFESDKSTELGCNPKLLPPTSSKENLQSRQMEKSDVSDDFNHLNLWLPENVESSFENDESTQLECNTKVLPPPPTYSDENLRSRQTENSNPNDKPDSMDDNVSTSKTNSSTTVTGRSKCDNTEVSTFERQFSSKAKSKGRRKKTPTLQAWLATAPISKSSQNITDDPVGLHSPTKYPCTKDINVYKNKTSTTSSPVRPSEKMAEHDQLNSGPLSELPGNTPVPTATTTDAAKDVDNTQKPPSKSGGAKVTKKRGRPPKKQKPSDKNGNCYDFLSTSKDSFIIDDNKQVQLPRLQRPPTDCNENEAPVRRPSRARHAVSYAEPKLSTKLRRGDKHTDGSLYVSLSPKKIKLKNAR